MKNHKMLLSHMFLLVILILDRYNRLPNNLPLDHQHLILLTS